MRSLLLQRLRSHTLSFWGICAQVASVRVTSAWVTCVTLACVTVACGCRTTESPSRAHPVYPSQSYHVDLEPLDRNDPNAYFDGFDYQTQGPLEFLEMLARNHESSPYVVWGTHRDWIRESDIPELLARLDSDQPCAAVQKEISSFHNTQPSTVGREAAFLIEGFRAQEQAWGYGGYPPALSSGHGSPDPESLRSWWAHRNE